MAQNPQQEGAAVAAIPKPAFRYEWNLNSIVQLFTLASMVFIGGTTWAYLNSSIGEFQRNFDRESVHTASQRLELEDRIRELETERRVIDNLEYRMNLRENEADVFSRSIEDVRTTLNKQTLDIAIIKEAVTRDDKSRTT